VGNPRRKYNSLNRFIPAFSFFSLQRTASWRIAVHRRRVPLKRDGKVIREIGGSGDQDHAVAVAGAAAF
jgi:hypothetical protein